MPTSRSAATPRSRAAFRFSPRCSRSASSIWLPTVNTGFSEVMGSWKIMETSLPRSRRMRFSEAPTSSSPAKRMELPLHDAARRLGARGA